MIIKALYEDAYFNSIRLTIEPEYKDAASENLRRKIYNYVRSTS